MKPANPPPPPDLAAAAFKEARAVSGLSLRKIAFALDATTYTVWTWEQGRAYPHPKHYDDLRRLLYGIEVPHKREVWIRHYNHVYHGRAERSALTRGAWVQFRTRAGKERRRYYLPNKHPVALGVPWAEHAAKVRELGSLREAADKLRAGGRILLDSSDFETQALANTLDRYLREHRVDRGDLPPPPFLW